MSEEKLSMEELVEGVAPADKNVSMEDVMNVIDGAAESLAVKETAPEPEPIVVEEEEAEIVETMDDYAAELEASMRRVKEGDVVKCIIVGVDEQEVLVDMGYFAGGVISKENFINDADCVLKEVAVVGSEITATVIETSDNEGRVVLSRKEANDTEMWERFNSYLVDRTVLKVKVNGIVKGGAVANVEGMRAFIPASKLSAEFVEELDDYLGKELEVQVITADREDNRLVLSAKELLIAKANEEKGRRISKCEVGSVVEGEVESIKKYGAFIKLDNGLSGLLHVSQISDKRLKSPAAVLNVGDRVTVKIISIENNKLSLSIKALEDVAEAEKTDDTPTDYSDNAQAATSLGALLGGFKFD